MSELIKLKHLSAEVKVGITKFFRGATNSSGLPLPVVQPEIPKIFYGVFEMFGFGGLNIYLTTDGTYTGDNLFTDITKCTVTVSAQRVARSASNVVLASVAYMDRDTGKDSLGVSVVESATNLTTAGSEGLEYSDSADNATKGVIKIHVQIIGE